MFGVISNSIFVWFKYIYINIIAYTFFTFYSSLFSLFTLLSIFIFHIDLKESFSDSALLGSYSVDIPLIGISLLKYKITPLWIYYSISLLFTNPLWIFKIGCSFILVNVSVCWSGPVPCRLIFSSCLLFRLLLLLEFLWPPRPLPLTNVPLPPPRPPLTRIFLLSLFPD